MASRGRRPNHEPPIEIKRFASAQEIDAAIAKLRRRIQEVQSLDPTQVRYDDQRVYTAQDNIHTTILEIFGPNSPEYRRHRGHRIWHGGLYVGMPRGESQRCFFLGIPQTVTMLQGLMARLEERRAEFEADQAARVRSAFEGLDLHPRIAEVCAELYRQGFYRNAVLDGYLALEDLVKQKSRLRARDGAPLIREVFSVNNPILAFNDRADDNERSEQEGLMHLFEGAALALRNPRAHSLVEDRPEEALEYIGLLSLLAKRLDTARRVREP